MITNTKFGKFGGKFAGERGRTSAGGAGHGFAKSGDTFGKRMELFDAVCSKCKKDCKVPFRPTGDKPVYCRDCFSGQGQIPGRNSNGKDQVVISKGDFYKEARPSREYQPLQMRTPREDGVDGLKRQLIVIESKVNRILEIVSKKTEE